MFTKVIARTSVAARRIPLLRLYSSSPTAVRGHTRAAVKSREATCTPQRSKAGYEGDGKTTVRVLNQDHDAGLLIDTYATYGFRLNNGITVLGPMAIFPRTVLSWQVPDSNAITPESLKLFKLLEPKIDLVVVGLESSARSAVDRVFQAARALGLNVEILPTEHACPTFNFLNAEGRCVAGALVPPLIVTPSEDDMLEAKLHYENIYEKDLMV